MFSREELLGAVATVEALDPVEAHRRLVRIVKEDKQLIEIIRGHMTDPAMEGQTLAVFSGQRDVACTNIEIAAGLR